MIGRKARQRQQQKLGPELERHDHAHGGRIVVGQLGEDEPVLGDALHPCAHVGYDRPAGPDSVVEALQGTESAFHNLASISQALLLSLGGLSIENFEFQLFAPATSGRHYTRAVALGSIGVLFCHGRQNKFAASPLPASDSRGSNGPPMISEVGSVRISLTSKEL